MERISFIIAVVGVVVVMILLAMTIFSPIVGDGVTLAAIATVVCVAFLWLYQRK